MGASMKTENPVALAGGMNTAVVVRLATNLARNCGYRVFPCSTDKKPTLKGWPERASTDAAMIERLWREHPGPLIGIVCGERSGVDVLDLDVKHDAARD